MAEIAGTGIETERTNTTIIDHKKLEDLNFQLMAVRGTKSALEKMYDGINQEIKKIVTPLADDMEDTKTFLLPNTKIGVSNTSRVDVDGLKEYLVKNNVSADIIKEAVKAATKTGYRFTVAMRTDLGEEE